MHTTCLFTMGSVQGCVQGSGVQGLCTQPPDPEADTPGPRGRNTPLDPEADTPQTQRQTAPPPHEQKESQMLVKILPCPQLRLRAVITLKYYILWNNTFMNDHPGVYGVNSLSISELTRPVGIMYAAFSPIPNSQEKASAMYRYLILKCTLCHSG